ncbi:hypothetical protein ACY2HL_004399 [Enterobacter roggenkampii]
MTCDISRTNTENNPDTKSTKALGFLFRISMIAVPIRIKANSILCLTEDHRLVELHFKQKGQSFSSRLFLHRTTLMMVDVLTCDRTREVKLFLGTAESLERY